MSSLRVATILGTRPEIIRLSAVIKRLDDSLRHVLIHTGQNYDHELNQQIFDDLELRQPDVVFSPSRSSLGGMIGDILEQTELTLRDIRPDAVLVLGDTNSCLSAIIAKRLHIPIFHMEAGNRCFDENVPEETNRRIIDHIADFNLTYTEHARRNLITEGIHPKRIYVTGSPLKEVLDHYRKKIEDSQILKSLKLDPSSYVLVSTHREENVDNSDRLSLLLNTLENVVDTFDKKVLVSAHPRLRKKLEQIKPAISDKILFHKPFGFIDYNNLQLNAYCTISDSGTISEESAILSFPAVTVRSSIERPEAMDTGSIIVTGINAENVIPAIRECVRQHELGDVSPIPSDYQIPNTSQRVLNLILGVTRLHSEWSGVREVVN
jgi:UDP-N-acetylglucosamine 2-epimerase